MDQQPSLRGQIETLRQEGLSHRAIARRVGITHQSVGYHLAPARRKKQNQASGARSRHRRKKHLIEISGGKCAICGYSRCQTAMEFHHRDPSVKAEAIALLLSCSLERIMQEVKKCVLLCSNCHREVHAGVASIPATT